MSKRILVIEDNADNRRILRVLLANAGFELIEAIDGERGIAMRAASTRPHSHGYPAAGPRWLRDDAAPQGQSAAARHSDHCSDIYALSGDEIKAREAGCDGYVTKPFSPREILTRIREFML